MTVETADALDTEARKPGRPRSTEADEAILRTAIEQFAEHGLNGLTVDAVATGAGVSKATVYRRYPSKADLVMAAARASCEEKVPRPESGDIRTDLHTFVTNMRSMLTDPVLGRAVCTLVADARRDDQLRLLHREFIAERRQRTMQLIRGAVDRGQLRPDTDLEVAADLLVAPLFYRVMNTGDPLDDAYLDTVVDNVMRVYGA
jgi:AcrR family transcriptional regulator